MIELVTDMHAFVKSKSCFLPLFMSSVSAGFPSPADDYVENQLDLNSHLIEHPCATFFVRVSGDSMLGAGIHDGDLLIVDCSLKPTNNSVVIAVIDGELTVKRLKQTGKSSLLVPENSNYKPIDVNENTNCEIWGIVTTVIHKV